MDGQKKSRHSNPFKISRRNSLLPTRDESRYRIRIRARTRLCVTIVGWPITRTDRESAATRSFLDKKLMEIYVTRQDVLQPLERIIEFAAGRRESPWTIFLSLSLSRRRSGVMVNRHSSAERNDGNPLRGTNDVISLQFG